MPNGKGYTITYDGVASTTIPEFFCERVKRNLVGARRHTTEYVPGREGAWVFPELPGLREIEVECGILADSFPLPRRGAVRDVARWIGSADTMRPMIISDDPDLFEMALLDGAPDVDEWRQLGRWKMKFIAMPYSYAVEAQEVEEVASSGLDTFALNVAGDVFSEPVIQITAAGALGSVELTLNGRTLVYDDIIGAADTVTFNSISKTVTLGVNEDIDLIGYFDVADLAMQHVSGLFPYLVPGANTLQVDAAVSGYTVNVQWRDRYQ